MEMSYGILKDNYLPEENKKLYVSILELLYTSRFEKAFESENISIICFVEFLILKENSYFHHRLAVNVLNACCWLEGAYSVALNVSHESVHRSAGSNTVLL